MYIKVSVEDSVAFAEASVAIQYGSCQQELPDDSVTCPNSCLYNSTSIIKKTTELLLRNVHIFLTN